MKQAKYYVMTAIGALLFAAGLYTLKTAAGAEGWMKTLPYLCVGVGCGMFGHGLGDILSKRAREKNPELAKQMDIDAKDERNIMLGALSKAKGFNAMTYVFAALMIAYALMNVDLGVILSFVAAYLFVQFFTVYHRVKMDRER